ncbi:hypothetical protein LIER_31464 [Lithospermum erythrorhizon]|uniref:Uncharacterized protein n=1 Tax=Lithospermum erythrorhizon TaxID=34254 RepID=A0AAV3RR23_LITER
MNRSTEPDYCKEEAPQATLEIPQSFIVTFTDEGIPEEDGDHKRQLYVSGYSSDVKISRMLVDGDSAVNILPLHILKLLNISIEDLQTTIVMIQGFDQGRQWTQGKLSPHLVIGKLETISWFHVRLQRHIQYVVGKTMDLYQQCSAFNPTSMT